MLAGVKVLVDMPEELFQSLKSTFGTDKLQSYIGTIGMLALQRAVENTDG
jgi:hypothetical protein